jgi:ferredoxin
MGETEWMPRIAQSVCNGCGECIKACPTNALGWQDGKASLLHPDKCIYCATCESICPVGAIELPYLVLKVTTPQQGEK